MAEPLKDMKIVYDEQNRIAGMEYSFDPSAARPRLPEEPPKRQTAPPPPPPPPPKRPEPDEIPEEELEDYFCFGGMEMFDIESLSAERYGDAYEKVAFDVYRHKETGTYHFAFAARFNREDPEDWGYFLDALTEDYGLLFGGDMGKEKDVHGEKKSVVEVHTSGGSIEELVQLLNFSTIVGNTVGMADFGDYAYLVKCYGMGKATYNGKPFEIPVYGYRSDRDGLYNFGVIYPELHVKSKFEKGFSIRGPQRDVVLKYVVVKDRRFYVVMTMDGKQKALRFSLQGFEKVVDDI